MNKNIKYLVSACILLLTFVVFLCQPTSASVTRYSTDYVVVKLAYGKPTNLRFEKDVISFPESKEIKVNWVNTPKGKKDLSVVPVFTSGTTKTVFTLKDGSLVKLKFVILKGKKAKEAEPVYVMKKIKRRYQHGKAPRIPELKLIRFMYKDFNVVGYNRNKLKKVISKKDSVTFRLVRHYRGRHNSGYVIEVDNQSNKKVMLNPSMFSLGTPNQLIYASSEDLSIGRSKKGESKPRIFLVSRRSEDLRKSQIPFESITMKKDVK